MARKRVTLAYITDNSDRKVSYRKRKKGFIKKANELKTLCGVDMCAIIYNEYEEPVVWPSRQGAEAVLSRFQRLPGLDQRKKMVNQEGFMRQRIKKVQDQLQRVEKENKRIELEMFMYKCIYEDGNLENFDINDAKEMSLVMNKTLNLINSKMEEMRIADPVFLPLTLGTGTKTGTE